jgi:hypothetical protein
MFIPYGSMIRSSRGVPKDKEWGYQDDTKRRDSGFGPES